MDELLRKAKSRKPFTPSQVQAVYAKYLTPFGAGEIAALCESHERLRMDLAWQPIDTAPKDGSWVYVWGKTDRKYWKAPKAARYMEYASDWITEDREWLRHGLTHWMPIPTYPNPTHNGA